MADIINYYEELNISRDLDLNGIQAELAKLKRVWLKREINQAEKARKMLTLIDDAYEIFRTDETRARYDRDLEDAKDNAEQNDDNIKLRRECDKKLEEAKNFYKDRQFDLAKICIDRALRLAEYSEDELSVYSWAASIYQQNDLYSEALNYINMVIGMGPGYYFHYAEKEDILLSIIEHERANNRDVSKYIDNHKKTCEVWAQKAAAYNDWRMPPTQWFS